MRQHPVSARLFLAAVVGIGAADLLCFGRLPPRGQFGEFAALMVAAIVSSAFKLKLPTKTRVTLSPSFVIDFASLLILGPGPTLLVAAVGSLAHSTVLVKKSHPLHVGRGNLGRTGDWEVDGSLITLGLPVPLASSGPTPTRDPVSRTAD